MKNPNRYGTVTRLSGNRRKPWIAREGKSGNQRPIGYAETKEEAMLLLANYNRNPWDLDAATLTVEQLYKIWLDKRAPKLGSSLIAGLKAAYKHCDVIQGIRYQDIRAYHMQDCIDNCGRGQGTQALIKNLFNHLDKFAMELDIINKCYSTLTTTAPKEDAVRTIFTGDEVARLWENRQLAAAELALVMLYSGWRKSEVISLKVDDINLDEGIMKGGCKTRAGKNRVVPIHSKIYPIVEQHCSNSHIGYLFELSGKQFETGTFRTQWDKLMGRLSMQHTPHETRHTFRTWMDSSGANKVAIDRIMGHVSEGTGERVYTHKTIQELKNEIEKVTN